MATRNRHDLSDAPDKQRGDVADMGRRRVLGLLPAGLLTVSCGGVIDDQKAQPIVWIGHI